MEQNFTYLKSIFNLPADAPLEDILAKLNEVQKENKEPWFTLLRGEVLEELKEQSAAKNAYKETNNLVSQRIITRLKAVSQALKELSTSLRRQLIFASIATALAIAMPLILLSANKVMESGLSIKDNHYTLTSTSAADELDGLNFARWFYELTIAENGPQNDNAKAGHLSFELGGGSQGGGSQGGGSQGNTTQGPAGGSNQGSAQNGTSPATAGDSSKGSSSGNTAPDTVGGGFKSDSAPGSTPPATAGSSDKAGKGKTRGDTLKFTARHTISPPFVCPEVELLCTKEEVPDLNKPWRTQLMDLFHLDNIYFSYSENCAAMSHNIDVFTSGYGWHLAEREVKCDVEARVASCFYKANEYQKAAEHARRAICSGLNEALAAMNILATIAKKNNDKELVKRYITCMDRFSTYYQNTMTVNAYTAYNHLAAGAYAWELNNDLVALVRHTDLAEKILPKAPKTVFLEMVGSMIKYHKMMISAIKGESDNKFYPLMHNSMNTPWNDERDLLHTHIYNFTRLMLRRDHKEAQKSFEQILARYRDMAEYDEKEPFMGLNSLVKNSKSLSKEEAQQMAAFFQILDGKKDGSKVQKMEKIGQFIKSL